MKNLYKIENELYVVNNNEDISENCWIITSGKLVQVSYLLSDEVAKGFKVILTTNKLLIKDGVQAIDDEFLEWFINNQDVDYVEITTSFAENTWSENYKIIIPKYKSLVEKMKPLQEQWQKDMENLEKILYTRADIIHAYTSGHNHGRSGITHSDGLIIFKLSHIKDENKETPKETVLHNKKLMEELKFTEIKLNHTKTLLTSCEKALESRDRQIKEMYSEEEVIKILMKRSELFGSKFQKLLFKQDLEWFESIKKINNEKK